MSITQDGKSSCALSIVVPVYRSAEILQQLVVQVKDEIERMGLLGNFELLMVCDASPDNSWEAIKFLSESHSFVKGTLLRRNFGQHNAIMAGLRQCSGDVVVIMDDDLQHSPRYISDFLVAIKSGADVCYCKFDKMQQSKLKVIGSKFNGFIANLLMDKPRDLYLSSFKAISKEICDLIICYEGPYPYIDGLILLHTDSIAVIKIEHQERASGKGNYNLRKSVSLWLMMATGFSVRPLRLASLFGFFISIGAFILIFWLLYYKLIYNIDVQGWTSLAIISLFMGGMQLMALGIVGEYLGRSYLKLNGKPQAIVKEMTRNNI